MQALTSPGVMVFFQPKIGGRRTDAPPKPVRPSVTGWGALNGLPNHLDPAYPPKNGFPFAPRGYPWGVLIDKPRMPGGLFGLSRSLHPQAPARCSIYRERHCEGCGDRTGHPSGARTWCPEPFSGHVAESIRVVDQILVQERCDFLGYCADLRRLSQTEFRSGKHSGWCKTH
jgi:hypothetical protein